MQVFGIQSLVEQLPLTITCLSSLGLFLIFYFKGSKLALGTSDGSILFYHFDGQSLLLHTFKNKISSHSISYISLFKDSLYYVTGNDGLS
jgi:hypothetical protein